jgi:hypothetical protein
MGINTDLNVDPYYDDFAEAKQFNRVLFKPAKAVQARELTQLQTILQKQVERFGSNVYKEGTIISGINLTARDDLFYVKLNDQTGFVDPTIYDQISNSDGTKTSFTITGQTSGLRAEIVKAESGFQTQDPNLKTFFVKYLNTTQDNQTDVKQFLQGENLKIRDSSEVLISDVTVASVSNHVGKSFGVSCEEGVIYQKGHFIFVDNQFIIVSKYTSTPGTVSVGFTVKENLIDSDSDTTLLDNASGFNNENAPGADRLQLVPTLVSYNTATEPTEFFALIRYVDGKAVRIRDVTEFNTVTNEIARRTYEESGNYVVNGLNVSLEKDGNNAYAVVSPGKAYVYGKEVTGVSSTKLLIPPVTATQSKTAQHTGVSYGQYFTYNPAAGQVLQDYELNGTRYNLLKGSDAVIGSCSVANAGAGKLYVYGIVKSAGEEATTIVKVGTTTLTNGGKLFDAAQGSMIFDTGKNGISSISNVSVVKRVRDTSISLSSATFTLTGTGTEKPLITDIYALTSGDAIRTATTVYSGNDVDVTLSANDGEVLYYSVVETNVAHDTLAESVGFVKTIYSATNGGHLGVPNAVEIVSVKDNFGAVGSLDVTSKFRLVRNQKDGYYGRSYITLYAGETLANSNLLIEFRYLKRTSTVGGGYLIANSYANVTSKYLVHNYTSRSLVEHNLMDSYDFRPYASDIVAPSLGSAGAPTISSSSPTALSITRGIAPANSATLMGNQTYYMSRIDSVVLDEYSNITLLKGGEDENPSVPSAKELYAISNITIPGNTTSITGEDKITVSSVSTKNYTMKDIGQIEQKIDGLIDIVSLSLLEKETSNMEIRDDNGLNRFKNGILADNIRDLNVADIRDPEFRAAIDRTRTVATPAVTQFPVDLKVGGSSGVNTAFPDIVTLADTGTKIEVISQPYATNFRNCVSNFYSFEGKAVIDPPFSSGYDVIQNPAVNIEIDIAGPMLDLVDNLQELQPLTTETLISEERTGTNRPRRRVIMGEFLQTIEETSLTSSTSSMNQEVGNFITDINMKPYLRRQEIKVLVTGLRPNTKHYFFFDQKSVDSHVSPGTSIAFGQQNSSNLDVKRVGYLASQSGNDVRSDSNGVLSAVFILPASTFFVGENVLEVVDVDTYTSIESASTSYGRATYRGYNFAVNKTDLSVTTRTPDFDTSVSITTREVQRQVGDPIAQTFRVKSSSTNNSNVAMLSDVDVYFKQKSSTTGVTLQIREVVNGYPSKKVLPFASKHLAASQVLVSDKGITATSFTFDNPVRLSANAEYAFVVIPDANSPDYLIYTSKVGATSLSKGTAASNVAVTNDWGDGVLFTSTNDSAWKSYQDEDIKFTLKRYDFNASGTVDLVPNDMEFMTVRENTLSFIDDEYAYIKKSQSYTAGVSGDQLNILTISNPSTAFLVGDYLYLQDSTATNDIVAKILDLQTTVSTTTITLDTPFFSATETAIAFVCVAGRVSHYNSRKADELHIKGSSATPTNFIDDNAVSTIGAFTPQATYTITNLGSSTTTANWTAVGAGSAPYLGQVFVASIAGTAGDGTARENSQVIKGIDSGATAKVTGVNNKKISYFQPQVYTSDTMNTSSDLTLYDGASIDKAMSKNANIYTQNNLRTVMSKSRIVNAADATTEDFKIRVSMANNSYSSATPIVDKALSEINAYQYHITNSASSTSSWITKEVVLKEGLEADGIKVLLAAYRPAGTFVEAYARFVYPENIETKSAWIELDNANPDLYSNTSNTKDYRQFEYNLADSLERPNNFRSFQLKFVIRHGVTGAGNELDTPELGTLSPDINLFAHIFDYRAIALT